VGLSYKNLSFLGEKERLLWLLLRMQCYIKWCQYQSNSTEQLNQHMQRRTSGIFESITDCITDDTSFVGIALLAKDGGMGVMEVDDLTCVVYTQIVSLDIFLGIVPCAAAVV